MTPEMEVNVNKRVEEIMQGETPIKEEKKKENNEEN